MRQLGLTVLVLALTSIATLGCNGSDQPPGDAGSGNDAPGDGGPPDVGNDAGPSCAIGLSRADTDIPVWPALDVLTNDPTTETGYRLVFDPAMHPSIGMRLAGYLPTLTVDMATVDGFGTSAEAVFSYARHFDDAALTALPLTPAGGVGFVVISPGPVRFVPAIVETTDEGATLLLAPLRPLPEHAEVAAFVTRAVTAAAGGCVEPSADLAATLAAPDMRTQAALGALTTVGAITAPSDLVGLIAYPTQSTTADSVAVAADIATRTFDWMGTPTCTDETNWRHCEGHFVAQEYRDADRVYRRARGAAASPRSTYVLPVSIWLPLHRTGPVPMLIYGHGLGGGRDQGEVLAGFAAPMGIATVAIDAQAHGGHPTAVDPTNQLGTVLDFFGFNLSSISTRALEAGRLRDNFRGSTWDKLQLLSLLLAHPDVDGDGAPDLDTARYAYLGVSLGGIMGPELLALEDDLGAGLLVVPGGRVSSIISEGMQFASLIRLATPRGTTPGDVRRFFPILQTIIERGDSASYGPHILADRLPGAGDPQSVLVGIVLDDDTVGNVSNYVIARALGDVPVLEPQLRAEPGLSPLAGPIMGNFPDGHGGFITAGIIQFDVIGVPGGGSEMATHSNVGDSDVGSAAWLDFLDTHFHGSVARIRDPYAAIGLPHGM
jgi:hypothetical protein